MPHDKAAAAALAAQPDFAVLPENWPALQVFLACSTQWRVSPAGRLIGLDYPAVESVMRLHRLRDRTRLFGEVQVIETGALSALNKK